MQESTNRHVVVALALVATMYTALAFRLPADARCGWTDDPMYRFEAKCLALGKASVAVPPESDAFHIPGVTIHEGRLFGKYYPGFPAVLALGERVGEPWIINPLLFGLMIYVTFMLGSAALRPSVGAFGAALLAVSPFALNLTTTYMSHVLCAALLTGSAAALFEARKSERTSIVLLAGFVWAAAFLTRPPTALAAAVPLGILALFHLREGPKRAWRRAIVVALAAASGPVTALLWNGALTGESLTSAYEVSKPHDAFGFGNPYPHSTSGLGPYTVEAAFDSMVAQFQAAGRVLFPWRIEGMAVWLLAIPIIVPIGFRDARHARWFLPLAIISPIGLYFFYHGTRGIASIGLGPRYIFEAAPLYFLLVAWLVERTVQRLGLGRRTLSAGLILILGSGGIVAGRAHWERLSMGQDDRLSRGSRRLESFLAQLPEERRLIFVDISTYNTNAALLANDANLQNENLVAIYRWPQDNRRVMAAYPGRTAYLFQWEKATDRGVMTPYNPDVDRKGPPKCHPYWSPKGYRFPPPEGARGRDESGSESRRTRASSAGKTTSVNNVEETIPPTTTVASGR